MTPEGFAALKEVVFTLFKALGLVMLVVLGLDPLSLAVKAGGDGVSCSRSEGLEAR